MIDCKSCGELKQRTDFYISNKSKCKECIKSNVRKNRAENISYYREYDRKRSMNSNRVEARQAYANTEDGILSANSAKKKWEADNPDRKKASTTVGNAVRDGRLDKHPCFSCGNSSSEGHHPDYSRPLDVTWLCSKHHAQLHKDFRELLRKS